MQLNNYKCVILSFALLEGLRKKSDKSYFTANRWKTIHPLTGLGKHQLFLSPDEFLLTCYKHSWSTLLKLEKLFVLRIDVMINSTTSSLRLVYHQIKLNFLQKPSVTSHGWGGWISVEWSKFWGACISFKLINIS